MIPRRAIWSIAASAAAFPLGRAAPVRAAGSFDAFLADIRVDAKKSGISQRTLDAAFAGIAPNQKVIERDRRQAEFSMSWSKYRGFAVSEQRIAEGRRAVEQNRALLRQVEQRYDVSPRAIAGIWGMESGFGAVQGDYKVIEALATLAWEGRRAKFFCAELMAALKILDQGHIAPARMLGSWAGAMGQPQFMPTSYLNMAADFDGDGKKDIWTNKGDVFASIANYLSRSGWRGGESWGLQVVLPASFDPSQAGRDNKRKIADWERAGVKPLEGPWGAPPDRLAAIVVPDPAESEAFAVFQNFAAIRRYNPSDYYAAAVGLLGDRLGA